MRNSSGIPYPKGENPDREQPRQKQDEARGNPPCARCDCLKGQPSPRGGMILGPFVVLCGKAYCEICFPIMVAVLSADIEARKTEYIANGYPLDDAYKISHVLAREDMKKDFSR